MKKLTAVIFTALLALSSANAFASEDLPEFMIEREVSVKEIAALDYQLSNLKQSFAEEYSKMPEARDYMEGKIQAAMINMIEQILNDASNELNSITGDLDLNRETIDSIKMNLDEAEELISEMN